MGSSIKNYKILIPLALLISFLPMCSNENNNENDFKSAATRLIYPSGVVKNNNSAIRIQPMIYSSRITTLSRGTRVKIIDKSGKKDYIAKTRDYWYKVKTDDNTVGWTYGTNLQQFQTNDAGEIDEFTRKLHEEEIKKLLKSMKGKWWSINKWGHYTNYVISIFPDGKYMASHKNSSRKIKGKLEINPTKSTITFDKSTNLGKNYSFFKLGGEMFLEMKKKKYSVKFKRIALEPEQEKK